MMYELVSVSGKVLSRSHNIFYLTSRDDTPADAVIQMDSVTVAIQVYGYWVPTLKAMEWPEVKG